MVLFVNHLNLVNTSLSISSRSGGSNSREAYISVIRSLAVTTGSKALGSNAGRSLMVVMVGMVMVSLLGVEGEGVEEGSLSSVRLSSQLAGSLAASQNKQNQKLCGRPHDELIEPAGDVNTSTAQQRLPM